MLEQSARTAVQQLGQPGGFNDNPEVRIELPGNLGKKDFCLVSLITFAVLNAKHRHLAVFLFANLQVYSLLFNKCALNHVIPSRT